MEKSVLFLNEPALGVIGGMGPMASAYFMELVTDMTEASCDQEHLTMYIASCPSVPDRTAFILGESEDDPVPGMIDMGLFLQSRGVSCIAIPCMTAHYFHDRLQESLRVQVIDAIEETAGLLFDAGIRKAGVMATDGSVKSGIFHERLKKKGIEYITPDEAGQKKVMSLIYDDVKTGRKADLNAFFEVSDSLFKEGAEAVILGCTELSVIKRDNDLGRGFIDCMEVLSKVSLETCGKPVKKERSILFERREG
ncbi:MAG: amino acid racemase [Lachnospiraceae bacterium]|nr:amino acid racemase [Lachnospiraceae bacterium]